MISQSRPVTSIWRYHFDAPAMNQYQCNTTEFVLTPNDGVDYILHIAPRFSIDHDGNQIITSFERKKGILWRMVT